MFEILTLAQTRKLSKKLLRDPLRQRVLGRSPRSAAAGRVGRDQTRRIWICCVGRLRQTRRSTSCAPTLMTHHMVPETRAGGPRARHRQDARLNRGTKRRMDSNERTKLIAQYKDGYRAVAEALLRDHAGGARREPGAGQMVGARDRASPRRQRDDRGRALPAARSRRTGPTIKGYDQDASPRRLHYDRPHEASLELFRCARARDRGADRLPDARPTGCARARTARSAASALEHWLQHLRPARAPARAIRSSRARAATSAVTRRNRTRRSNDPELEAP